MPRPPYLVRLATRVVVTLVLTAVTVVCAAWIAPSLLGMERYVITGGSMSGTFEKGSVVFSEPVPVNGLQEGDVITYLPPADSGVSTLVTHRIVSVKVGEAGSPVFRTQGDANPDPDPWRFSLTDDEQPVVRHAVPYVGNAFIALADPRIRIAVVGLPASLIALLALRDLVHALRPVRSGAGASAGKAPHALPADIQATPADVDELDLPVTVIPAPVPVARAHAVRAAHAARAADVATAQAARAAGAARQTRPSRGA